MGQIVHDSPAQAPGARLRFKLAILISVVVSILILSFAWSFSSLREWLDIDRMVSALRHFADGYGLFIAALAMACALILAVPLTFLTLVVMVAYGPTYGFVCTMAGAQIGALCSYVLGVMLGRDIVRKLGGVRVNAVSQKLARNGLLAVIAARMVPVAPFAVVNMVAGAFHIGLRDLLLGTLLGMAPGTLVIALFIDKILEAIRNPGSRSGIVAVFIFVLLAMGIWLVQRWVRRRK